jgi:hypothetical protein
MVLAFDEGPDRKMGLSPGNLSFDSLFKVFLSRMFVPPESFFVDFSASFTEFSCDVLMKISVLDQSQFRGISTSIDVRNIIFYGLQIPASKDDRVFIEQTEDLLHKGESRKAAFFLLAWRDCLPMLNLEFPLGRILSIFLAEEVAAERRGQCNEGRVLQAAPLLLSEFLI